MGERTASPCVHCGGMSLIIGGKSAFFRNVWGINHDGMSVVIGGKLQKIYDIMCAAERTVGAEVHRFVNPMCRWYAAEMVNPAVNRGILRMNGTYVP